MSEKYYECIYKMKGLTTSLRDVLNRYVEEAKHHELTQEQIRHQDEITLMVHALGNLSDMVEILRKEIDCVWADINDREDYGD